MRDFHSLSEREILALAISLEEEDERIYADFTEGLRDSFPASAAVFAEMQKEESGHRRRLLELYHQKFGDHIPLIRHHEDRAEELGEQKLSEGARESEAQANRRLLVLQIIQPGLAGLMDGSVSTLAPVFAAALATRESYDAFLVGLAASVGA